jgi:DHA1 family tetracycline resistance protein-like MFS transporter
VFTLQLAYTLGLTTCYEFYPLWLLENAGMGGLGIAWVTAGLCLVMVLASMLVGRFDALSARGHALQRAGACALLAAAGLLGLAVLPGPAGLAVIIAMGLPLSLYNAVLPAWVSERFAEHGQGRVMGLLTVIFYLANVLTALVGGALSLLDTRWIMAVGGGCSLWASWSLLRLARDVHRAPAVAGGQAAKEASA